MANLFRKIRLFYKLLLVVIAAPLLLVALLAIRSLQNNPENFLYSPAAVVVFMLALTCVLLAITFIRRIFSGLHTVREIVNNLSSGSYQKNEKMSGTAEIITIANGLNTLADSLKNKAGFVSRISAGDLEATAAELNEHDMLDKALIGIKENLIRLKAEEQQRAWTTDALGKFVDILRINKDLKELSNAIIINLVQTLRANQGAIFIITKDQEGNEYLEMEACYAYNKTKHLTKKIEIGNGVIGQAYLEKQTVHLKNVPDDFVRITSGLGDANPRNILIIPLQMNEVVTGIIELAAFHDFPRHEIDFAERIGENIAHTITTFKVAENTKMLLKKAGEHAEQMRSQEEELRQNQEELQATQEEISRKYEALFGQLKALNYESKFDQLLSITFARKRNVEYYFDIIRNQILTFAEDTMIREAMQLFASAFQAIGINVPEEKITPVKKHVLRYYEKEFIPRLNDNTNKAHVAENYFPKSIKALILQHLYISNNPYPTGKKSLCNDAGDGSEYSRVHAIYHPLIRSYLEKFGYYDIFLLDKTGELVYSVFKEVDYATNVVSELYSKTNFGRIVREAIASKDKNFVKLIDFEMYDPSYGAPASFIARPVYEGETKIGIVVFQMPINKVNQILTGDNHWREDGLGKSGETFMVGSDYRLRSITRGLIESPDNYLALLKKQAYSDDTIRQIGKTGINILLENVKLDGVMKALQGTSGKQQERNAFGHECLYTFAPLNIPDVHWVIMSTLQEAEASQSIESLRKI